MDLTLGEKELLMDDNHEKSKRFIQNAIEMVLSLGDFQKEIECRCTPRMIIEKTAERIGLLVNFEAAAFYLVDEETSDMRLELCTPEAAVPSVEEEMEFLIREGFVAWAIREQRGVTIYSRDGSRRLLLHVLSTYSRTRGIFFGIFPQQTKRLPDASLEILSIILRNGANSLESLTYSCVLQQQKDELQATVAEKTQKLIQYERQLMQAQKTEAIAALAGGIAHQFNNALFALTGNIDLAVIALEKGAPTDKYIQQLRPIAERMSHLTQQLLAYAQGGNYRTQAIDLRKLVSDTLPPIRRSIKPGIQLELALPEKEIPVKVDQTQLQMVIKAIVNNADEAIEAGGCITISAGAEHIDTVPGDNPDAAPGDYACLSIRDNGKGMDKETLRRVFEPFFTTKFQGRGLSMAAVFGIISNHNGWIDLHSEVGAGTCVTICLPLSAHPARGN